MPHPNTGVSMGRKVASKKLDDVSGAGGDGKRLSSLEASLLADQAPLPAPPATDTSTVTLSTDSTPLVPRSSPYPRKISLVPQRPLPPYLINPEKSAAPSKDADYTSNKLTTPDFGAAVGAVALSNSSNTIKAATTTSFANATADIASSPATKSKGDGDMLSLSVHEGTPAHDALQANAAIRVRRMHKVARKLQVPQVLHAVKKTGSSVINPNLIHKGKKPPRIPILNDSIEAAENDLLHQQEDLKSPNLPADSAADDGRHRQLSKPLEQEEVKFVIDSEVINNASTSDQNTLPLTEQSTYKDAARVVMYELSRAVPSTDDEGPVAVSSPETSINIASIKSESEEDHQHGENSIPEVLNDTSISTVSISKRPTLSHRRAKTEGNLSTSTSKTQTKRSSSTRRLLFPQSGSKSQPKEENETTNKKSHRKQRSEKQKKKKEKHARKSYVKGKVIDRKHELYTLSLAVMLGLRTSIGTTNTILERSQKEDLINRLNSYASNNDVENSEKIDEVAAGSNGNVISEEQHSESKRDSILDMLRADNLTGKLATVSRMIKEYKEKKKVTGTDAARWLESYDFMAVEKYVFRPKVS
jgi:hypothetical protein